MRSDDYIQHVRASGGDYRLPPDVILLRLPDGTGQLLDLGGDFHALSETAMAMLLGALCGDEESAIRDVASAYSAPLDTVRADFGSFLADLNDKGLVRASQEGPRPSPRRSTVLPRVVLMALTGIHATLTPLTIRMTALATLSYMSVRLLGWPRTVATLQAFHRMRPALETTPDRRRLAALASDAIRRVAARHPLAIDCKERALSSWTLLRAHGLRPILVVGVAFPPKFHCWCELDGVAIGEDENVRTSYTRIADYA